MKKKICAGCRKPSCDGCRWNMKEKLHTNKTKTIGPMSGLANGGKGDYGLVFDVGTTTVAGYLWNMQTGECICAESMANPQRKYGSDVVSRITYCLDEKGTCEEKRLQELQKMIVEALDYLAGNLASSVLQTEEGLPGCNIRKVVVVGNTAMCSIVAGISVESLGKAPFKLPYFQSVRCRGSELGFVHLRETDFVTLCAIDGYVGADALSVYHYVKEMDHRKNILAVDIGTNGEIILIGENKIYACSTAAGPALEGAAVTQGMCGTEGAIEEVKLIGSFPLEDILCRVIGEIKPQGICGSGLVDALALLYKLQVIDKDGYLRSRDEARKAGARERICQRIIEIGGERKFLLADETYPVYLTAGDIRQLQLAKGAIAAAIQILLDKADLNVGDLSGIYLAGAFGNYIKTESAIAIGLLPGVNKDMVMPIGNCAALGGAMALLSEDAIKEMEQSALEIEHVELAKERDFEKYFVQFMSMP